MKTLKLDFINAKSYIIGLDYHILLTTEIAKALSNLKGESV
jgi:hypothetical protein